MTHRSGPRAIRASTNEGNSNRESGALESAAVGVPGRRDGLLRVVKQIDVARYAGRPDQLVQGHGARHVALARRDPIGRNQAADGSLELGESHLRSAPALRKAATSPYRSM